MKIWWKYSSAEKLIPTKGDHITEMNTIKAVSKFADVIYGGVPPPDCDLYYLRACPKALQYIPDNKPVVYFASPWIKECYERADMITTFTDAWTERIKNGVDIAGFPEGLTHKNVQTVHQTIDDMFKPYKDHARTLQIRNQMGGEFIIGHFGTVREGSYPKFLLKIIDHLKKYHPETNIVFAGDGIEHPLIKKMNFDYTDMPYALSACDLVMYNVWRDSGNIGGSLKILEAMACGTPIICPLFDARKEELGEDYPLMYDWKNIETGSGEMLYKMMLAIRDKDLMKDLSTKLIKRSEFYSMECSSKRLKMLFRDLVK